MEWDEVQYFLIDLFYEMGQYGFLGVLVFEVYGGAGFNYQVYIIVIEEIVKVCGFIGFLVVVYNLFCINYILMFGDEE